MLQGKVALVTGSGKGIGRAIAELFASNGAAVVINYHESAQGAEEAARTIAQFGHERPLVIQADVSDSSQVQAMMDQIIRHHGHLDILVNNAGTTIRGKISDITEEQWDRVLDVNLKGPFLCSKAASVIMRRQGNGVIVNIASIRGIEGSDSSLHYAVSKAGVINLTKCLARELAPVVRVNCISPGYVFTDLHRSKTDEQIQEIVATVPLKKFGQPQDIAEAALFFASDASRYVTGAMLTVSGGLAMI